VALVIFPVGILVGWFVHPPRRAATATHTLGFGAFVVLSLLWGFTSVELDLFEPVILLVGTPLAGALASTVSRWRLSRRDSMTRRPLDKTT
jgi:hypothetical protein